MLVQISFDELSCVWLLLSFVSQLLNGESLLSIRCDLPSARFSLTHFLNQSIFSHRGKMVCNTFV